REPGLAYARLARHQHQSLRTTGALALPRHPEPLHLLHPADKADGLGAGERTRKRHTPLGDMPRHLRGRQRRLQTLQLECTDGPEIVTAARSSQQPHNLADQDLLAPGVITKSAGLDHRRPETIVAFPEDVACAETDAYRAVRRRAPIEPVDAALHRLRRADRLDSRIEHDHEPVARALNLAAAVRGDRVPQHAVVGAAQLV